MTICILTGNTPSLVLRRSDQISHVFEDYSVSNSRAMIRL